MLDPYKIPRPAMFPMERPCRMTSQNGGPATPVHYHRAYPDRHGNGVTSVDASHMHFILNGEIIPSSTDNHSHTLTGIPCGSART